MKSLARSFRSRRRRWGVGGACALMIGGWLSTTKAAEFFHFEVPFGAEAVRFDGRWPKPGPRRAPQVLLLVPGSNGLGEAMLTPDWARFADRHGLVLLAPTFRVSPAELKRREGYYYPARGSGAVVERALDAVAERGKARVGRIFIFGFSAGAHFGHRFALWRPSRVAAFAAGAAGWWDAPTEAAATVPALIFCGEDDPREEPSRAFFEQGLSVGAPWVWRSYRGVDHQISPAMLALARVFLAHYADEEKDAVSFGDLQTYEVTVEAEDIPEAARVRLPSAAIARAWARER